MTDMILNDPHEPGMQWKAEDRTLFWRLGSNAPWYGTRVSSAVPPTPERVVLWATLFGAREALAAHAAPAAPKRLARAERAAKAAGFEETVSPARAIKRLVERCEALEQRVVEADDRAARTRSEVSMVVRDQYRDLLHRMGAPSTAQMNQTVESLYQDVAARISAGAKNKDALVRIAKTLGLNAVAEDVTALLARVEPMIAGLVARGAREEPTLYPRFAALKAAVAEAITLLGGNPDLLSTEESGKLLVENVAAWKSDRAANVSSALRRAAHDALVTLGGPTAVLSDDEAAKALIEAAKAWQKTAELKPEGHPSREALQTLVNDTRKALDDAGYAGAMPEMVRNLNAHRHRAHERAYKFRGALIEVLRLSGSHTDDDLIAALKRLATDQQTAVDRLTRTLGGLGSGHSLNALLDRFLPQYGQGPTTPEDATRITTFLTARVPAYAAAHKTDPLNALLLVAGGWHTDSVALSKVRQIVST